MSKREDNHNRRRSDILAAARGLFAEQGIEETSMAQIAEASGCSRRTLYAYFPSWDELAMQVSIEDINDRWQMQKQALSKKSNGLDQLRIWGQSYYQYTRKNPFTVRFQFFWDYRGFHNERIGPEGLKRFRETTKPIVNHMLQVFRSGQKDGSIRTDLEAEICMGQYAYSIRAILNRALFPAESFADFEPDKFVHNYIDLFLRGIAQKKENSP